MRCGMLAQRLVERGHDVVWWTSDFDHYRKRHRTGNDRTIELPNGLVIQLIKSLGYRSHIGPRRLVNNHLMGRRWRSLARESTAPDLLLAGWPIPELGLEASRYAEAHRIPVVLDVRDLWPSLWLDLLPERLHPLGRALLSRYFRMTRSAMSRTSAITGVTDSYVDWGVDHSGRKRTDLDRAFGFQFRPMELDHNSRIEAERALEGHGYAPDGRIDVVFAGTFSRSNDLEIAVEAGRRLDRIAPGKLRLVLCGSGDRWRQIELAAREIDSILVLPRLDLRELTRLYESASLGLASYRNVENFQRNVPNKINEYLYMSLPIIAGVEGSIADLIETHGVGVRYRPDDPVSMADELASLANDPLRLETLRSQVDQYREDHLLGRDDIDDLASHLESIAEAGVTS